MLYLLCLQAFYLGMPLTPTWAMGPKISRAITYSAETAQVIRIEFGQTVAVKKLSKIEKTAIKLSQWVN